MLRTVNKAGSITTIWALHCLPKCFPALPQRRDAHNLTNTSTCSARLLAASPHPRTKAWLFLPTLMTTPMMAGRLPSITASHFTRRKRPPCGTVGNTEPFAPPAVPGQGFYSSEISPPETHYIVSISAATIMPPLWRAERQIHPWCNATALGGVVAEFNLDQPLRFDLL